MEVRMICTCANFYPRSPCGERPRNRQERQVQHDFYPRSPCGERPDTSNTVCSVISISIHALLAESDFFPTLEGHRIQISIHALLAESDDTSKDVIKTASNFYPRSPCGERHQQTAYFFWVVDFYPRSPCGERPQCKL